jgi:hypothetical protein
MKERVKELAQKQIPLMVLMAIIVQAAWIGLMLYTTGRGPVQQSKPQDDANRASLVNRKEEEEEEVVFVIATQDKVRLRTRIRSKSY